MSRERNLDEERILAALEALEEPAGRSEGAPPMPRPVGDARPSDEPASDEAAALERLYVETLGLIPYAAEPVHPAAATKRRLMAAVAAGDDAPGTPVAPVTGASSAAGTASAAPIATASTAAAAHWFAAVAAVFALAAIGLAGWLYFELDRTRDALAAAELETTRLAADLESRQVGYRSERGRLLQAVSLMSTRGIEICPLQPVGESPLQPGAFAVLYMVPGKGDWYLQATNLEPPPAGEVYRVWFLTPDGPVAGGVLEPGPRADLRIVPGTLDEEEVLSVTVTREGSGSVQAPSGPPILYGDEKMQVI